MQIAPQVTETSKLPDKDMTLVSSILAMTLVCVHIHLFMYVFVVYSLCASVRRWQAVEKVGGNFMRNSM